MLKKWIALCLMMFAFFSTAYAADLNSPVGKWITVSDKSHQRTGMVQLYIKNGVLYGRSLKVFPGSGRDPNERCVKCEGSFKNKPVVGLTFLWGLTPSSDGTWVNGKVLDPHEGHVYTATLKLIDGGRKLQLRGYWGVFWRTQTWIRAE